MLRDTGTNPPAQRWRSHAYWRTATFCGVALTLLAGQAGSQELLRPRSTNDAGPGHELLRAAIPCVPLPVGQHTYDRAVSLGGTDLCGDTPGPWTVVHSPDGRWVYTTLFSGVFASSCTVLRLDADTLQLAGAIQVGQGPEEIAFTTNATGGVELGFVTNSTESTVSVFGANDQILATIPIPFDPVSPFQTAFPFGLAVSPDQSLVYVGTLDGCGDVFAIDVASLTLDTAGTLSFGPGYGFGRMTFAGSTLVIPTTEFNPGFMGSNAKLVLVDPSGPGGPTILDLVQSSDPSVFPSPQDVGIVCDRWAYVAGFDMGARIFQIDLKTQTLRRTIDTMTSESLGKFQGLAVSPRGTVAVADFITGEVSLIEGRLGEWKKTLETSSLPDVHTQLNEISFDPDGSGWIGAALTSQSLAVFEVH